MDEFQDLPKQFGEVGSRKQRRGNCVQSDRTGRNPGMTRLVREAHRQALRKGCRRLVQVEPEGVGKQTADIEYQTHGIPGMRSHALLCGSES